MKNMNHQRVFGLGKPPETHAKDGLPVSEFVIERYERENIKYNGTQPPAKNDSTRGYRRGTRYKAKHRGFIND